MNAYLLFALGLTLIFAGSFTCYLGQRRHSKEDSKSTEVTLDQKVESVLKAIHEAKSGIGNARGDSPQAKEAATKIASIEADFKTWADSFSKSKARKSAGFNKEKMEQLELELANTEKWRPLFQEWVDTIVHLCGAYNDSSGSNKIAVGPIALEQNLYDKPKVYPTITFGGHAGWVFDVVVGRPAQSNQSMSFVIAFTENGQYTGEAEFRGTDQGVSVNLRLMKMPTPKEIKTHYELSDKAGQVEAFQRLVETQILAVEGQQ
jgi:hypothetical protein